ncbi:MAG: hypothetical protein ACLP2Y_07085 [Limisphaerales bacterium]
MDNFFTSTPYLSKNGIKAEALPSKTILDEKIGRMMQADTAAFQGNADNQKYFTCFNVRRWKLRTVGQTHCLHVLQWAREKLERFRLACKQKQSLCGELPLKAHYGGDWLGGGLSRQIKI